MKCNILKKFEIKNLIFLIFIYLLTFSLLRAAQTDIISFYTNEAIIEGVTPRVEFAANLRVKTNKIGNNQYIDLKYFQHYNKNSFIQCENIQVVGASSNILKFQKEKNGAIKDILEFRIKGELIFHWKRYKKNQHKHIRLGKVYLIINHNKKEVGKIDIVLDDLNIVSLLKINVKNHMDFGTIIAGKRADTREAERNPARLEIEGTTGKRVKITIPQTTKIENGNGDALDVELRFREKSKQEGANKSIVKEILYENSKNDIGKTDVIEIDGSVTTRRQSHGNYKGIFTVRVEYEN